MTSLLHTHDDAIRDTCGYRNADTKDWDCVRDSGPASICEDNSGNQMLPTSSVRIYVTFLKMSKFHSHWRSPSDDLMN